MSDSPPLRAGDADRDAALDRLRDAAAQGRLEHEEFVDRVERAAAAKTLDELADLTADLPGPGALAHPIPLRELAVQQRGTVAWRETLPQVASWIGVFALCNLIWVLTGGAYWWPGWLLIPLGVTLLHGLRR